MGYLAKKNAAKSLLIVYYESFFNNNILSAEPSLWFPSVSKEVEPLPAKKLTVNNNTENNRMCIGV